MCRRCVVGAFVLASATLCASGCGGGRIEWFSATQVTLSPAGKEVSRRVLHVAPGRVRMEVDAPTRGGTLFVILRRDEGLQWVVNPEQSACFERPLRDEDWDRALRTRWKVMEDNVAREKVGGFACTVKRVEMETGFFGRGGSSRATVWV